DVEVEKLLDLFRLRKLAGAFHRARLIFAIFSNDVEADVDAFVADVNGRARDQLLHVALALVAEAATQDVAAVPLLRHGLLGSFERSLDSTLRCREREAFRTAFLRARPAALVAQGSATIAD